ncbi:hypothetical protein V8G54_009221, partial [Vigna mungo]
WEFPNQYVTEPTDGSSSGSYLSVSRKDGSIKLIDEISESNTIRVPKIFTIYGVAGMLRLLEGNVLSLALFVLEAMDRWIDLTSLNMMKPIKLNLPYQVVSIVSGALNDVAAKNMI